MPESEEDAARLRSMGQRIREMREAIGMSQLELARLSRTNRSYLGELERGRRHPGALVLWRIADALGVTPAAFFVRSDR